MFLYQIINVQIHIVKRNVHHDFPLLILHSVCQLPSMVTEDDRNIGCKNNFLNIVPFSKSFSKILLHESRGTFCEN